MSTFSTSFKIDFNLTTDYKMLKKLRMYEYGLREKNNEEMSKFTSSMLTDWKQEISLCWNYSFR
jgi:hypothetical protein